MKVFGNFEIEKMENESVHRFGRVTAKYNLGGDVKRDGKKLSVKIIISWNDAVIFYRCFFLVKAFSFSLIKSLIRTLFFCS
jgi:hypothetical protein